jgi:hypothetical protein
MHKQTQEALKMALEALDESMPLVFGNGVALEMMKTPLIEVEKKVNFHKKAINACKEALEQPAQEPHYYAHRLERCLEDLPSEHITLHREFISDVAKTIRNTHPHQWQGLTDDEIEKIDDETILATEFARAIEAKLKEKEKNYETT